MANIAEIPPRSSNNDEQLVPAIWHNEEKGLRKELVEYEYFSIDKPTELSKCLVSIKNIVNINTEHDTKYLKENVEEFWIEIGNAITPIDYYIELLLMEMLTNESSNCFIKTKSSDNEIEFLMKLINIKSVKYYFELSSDEMYILAESYKNNGVQMFTKYPKFAQQYFNTAAKCLLSHQPFVDLDMAEANNQYKSMNFQELLNIIYMNISACLIKEKRFDEIIYLLKFVDDEPAPTEKAIYRRAFAFFNTKKYLEARQVIERINFKNNKTLSSLYNDINSAEKKDNMSYDNIVRKMFS